MFYKLTNYKNISDEMVTKKKKAMREEKKQNLEYERKMVIDVDSLLKL